MPKFIIGSKSYERRKLQEATETGGKFAIIRAMDTAVEMDGEPEQRTMRFTISTDSIDRYGDKVAQDGWDLKAFKRNPVVLWMHDNTQLPLAKAVSVTVDGGKLVATAQFAPAEVNPFAEQVFQAIKGGFLGATSVGFLPIKYAFVDSPDRKFGIDFEEQELLEFSIVTVPANAEALVDGKSVGEEEPGVGISVDMALRRLTLARLRAV